MTFKKAALGLATTFFVVGSVAMIGWIGFQEHFRLLARSFQKEFSHQSQATDAENETKALADRTIIETPAEAGMLIDTIEGRLAGLEADGLPEE